MASSSNLISFFKSFVFIPIFFILIVQLLDGIPHMGHPYRGIGSMCLSKSQRDSLVEMLCEELIACLITNKAFLAFFPNCH